MGDIAPQVWPLFMLEDVVGFRYWNRLYTVFPEYQSCLVDDEGNVMATAYTVPFYWDGLYRNLPHGWDEVMAWAFADKAAGKTPNTLSALAAEIAPAHQSKGMSALPLKQMKRVAEAHGLTSMVAPVRPTLKSRYPLIPIEQYAYWQRDDGLPFDPWMRTHARLGATILGIAHRSMYIPGTIAEWEKWTGMTFPASGRYVIQGALEPISIDHEADLGEYYEPNVWMLHSITAPEA